MVGVVAEPLPRWENGARVAPDMDAIVNVICVHTEPNFSLPWQRKQQHSSSSSGFVIGGIWVLTNADLVEHYSHVKLKKRGSDTKSNANTNKRSLEYHRGSSLFIEAVQGK